MSMKTCTQCNNPFPSSPEFFHRQAERPGGLRDKCKICTKSNRAEKDAKRPRKVKPERPPVYAPTMVKVSEEDRACLKCYVIGGCKPDSRLCPKKGALSADEIRIYLHVAEFGPLDIETIAYDLDRADFDIRNAVTKLMHYRGIKERTTKKSEKRVSTTIRFYEVIE